jgi:cytochrome c
VVTAALVLAGAAGAQGRFPGVGRPATPDEVRAWDIDVRPDFTGLPKGSGSVAKGQEIWDTRCAACHGTFGESTLVFPPLPVDHRRTERGRVAALTDLEQRTTLMKLPTCPRWDYVNRAMPWTGSSLAVDEVYAVVAYLLHRRHRPGRLRPVRPEHARRAGALPNRDGMTLAHGLWDGAAPDVRGTCADPTARSRRRFGPGRNATAISWPSTV